MNQNLLYLVARHNVERIYGDGRFDWIDDAWTDAVVAEGARLPGREQGHEHVVGEAAPAKRTRRKSESMKKIDTALERLRKAGTK